MHSSSALDYVHRGMLDGLDEVEGGVVDLEGDHVSVDPGCIWKFGSQLLGKCIMLKVGRILWLRCYSRREN